MPQVFDDAFVLFTKLVLLGIAVAVVATVATVAWHMKASVTDHVALAQPIPFSHKHHVGDDGISCLYCHASVQKSAAAGMPSTETCLTCHAVLFHDAPVFEPLRASERTGVPLQWNRVHDLPDFVFFNHSIHVAKGVACVTCHGRVDQMPQMMRQQSLDMQWCLDCHRDPARHVGPLDQVFAMRDVPPLSSRDLEEMKRIYRFESEQRMTSCTTCHR